MRGEAVELLADVGLDGEEGRFLRQPLFGDCGAGEKLLKLRGDALADGGKAGADLAPRGARQRVDLGDLRAERRSKALSFSEPRGFQRRQRRTETLDEGSGQREACIVIKIALVGFDDAPQRKDRLGARGVAFDAAPHLLDRRDRAVERCAIDAKRAAGLRRIEAERGGDRAAGEHLARSLTHLVFDGVEAGRHAEAQLEPARIDALHFERPAPRAGGALGARKAGHRLDRHFPHRSR